MVEELIRAAVAKDFDEVTLLAAAGFPVYAERSLIGLGFLEASSARGRTAADGWRVFKDLSIKFRFAC